MTMHFASIKNFDIANGVGVRVSLFVSGCNHHCKECFNQEAWDFNYGEEFTDNEMNKIIDMLKPDYIKGLTLLGGEPMELVNQKGILPLVKKIKELYPNKTIWCYSGFTFEQIMKMMEEWETTRELVKYFDVLVDGKFMIEKKDLSIKFRGSSNQRLIDLPKSLEKKEVVLEPRKYFLHFSETFIYIPSETTICIC